DLLCGAVKVAHLKEFSADFQKIGISVLVQLDEAEEGPLRFVHPAGRQVGAAEYRQQLDVAGRLFKSITEYVDRPFRLSLLSVYVDDGCKGLPAFRLYRQSFQVGTESLIHLALSYELRAGHYEGLVGVIRHPLSRVDLCELHADRSIRRIEVGYLLVSLQCFPRLPRAGIGVGDLQILLSCLDQQALLRVEIGEFHRSIDVRWIQLRDLLKHRDCLQGEAAVAITVSNARKILNGVRNPASPHIEVAESIDRSQVSGIHLNYLAVFVNCGRNLALQHVLLGRS